jgi:hypothetical protein
MVANCTCTEDLILALDRVRTVFIRLKKCPVDIKPNLVKCKSCGLLEHTPNYCRYDAKTAAKVLQRTKNPNKQCADCEAHNKSIQERKAAKTLLLNPNHSTGDQRCQILKRQLKKYFTARTDG